VSSNSPKRQRERERETERGIEREIEKGKIEIEVKSEREKISKLFWNIHRRETNKSPKSTCIRSTEDFESDPSTSTGLSGQANQSEICLTTGRRVDIDLGLFQDPRLGLGEVLFYFTLLR
jgi:hypothetical protein